MSLRARAVITGAGGFSGPHLARRLLEAGFQVTAVTRSAPGPALVRLRADVEIVRCDLGDRAAVGELVASRRPEHIYHLASVRGLRDPGGMSAANLPPTRNLLEAALELGASQQVRFLMPGSASEYGPVDEGDQPVTELQPCSPVSPYGAMKVDQVRLALAYHGINGLQPVVGRAFNIVGPGEPDSLVCSSLARSIAAAALNLGPSEVELRDGGAVRDFVDVRDVADAYVMVASGGRPGEIYNICSGLPMTIGAVLDRLVELAGAPIKVREVGGGGPVRKIIGSGAKLQAETGWSPARSIRDSLAELLDEWQERLSRAGDEAGSRSA